MKFFGDIVIVEHYDSNITSSTLFIPAIHHKALAPIKARVVAIGIVPKHKRKKRKYYPCDDLCIGDTVLVPEHFGSRRRIKEMPKAIIYDGEDILAIVKES